MNVVLDMAISPNGLIARDDGSEDWLPDEGWDDFVEEAKKFDNIVMGRETYEIVTRLYDDYNFDNVLVSHKLIVTTNKEFKAPKGYTVVNSPSDAIKFLEDKKADSLFLIGGGKLNAEFLKQKLVNQIQLTINPYIIGKGRSFIYPTEFDLPLQLISVSELSNDRVQIKYKVKN